MAKVSIVRWSQNLDFVAGRPILGIPKVLITGCKTGNLDNFGYDENVTRNQI